MSHTANLRVLLRLVAGAAIAYCGWIFLDRYFADMRWERDRNQARQEAGNPEFDRIYGGSDLKILNFYARDASVVEGRSTLLCYAVLNAKTVRIDPPVDGVSPSLNRCLTITPDRETRYTLTAEGAGGRTESASFLLPVKPDPEALPQVTAFSVHGREVRNGRPIYQLYFATRNAVEVAIDPPVFAPNKAAFGHFYVSPAKTTTYTLTVTGKKNRTARKQLTVAFP